MCEVGNSGSGARSLSPVGPPGVGLARVTSSPQQPRPSVRRHAILSRPPRSPSKPAPAARAAVLQIRLHAQPSSDSTVGAAPPLRLCTDSRAAARPAARASGKVAGRAKGAGRAVSTPAPHQLPGTGQCYPNNAKQKLSSRIVAAGCLMSAIAPGRGRAGGRPDRTRDHLNWETYNREKCV